MAKSTRRRLIPLWAGAALALLAGGLAAPSKAQAGCSHYVVARSDRLDITTLASLDLLVPSSDPVAPPGPSPCAGLSCSSDPLVPPAPAPVPVRTGGEWGCLFVSSPPALPEPFLVLADLGPVHPIHHGLSIDRPPRLSGSFGSSRCA